MSRKISSVVSCHWKPDRTAKVPLATQIVHYIKERITQGDWVIGQRLPSQRILATSFSVNRSTIVDALSELVALGILETHFGQGTIIANNTWSLLVSTSTPDWNSYIEHGIHKANTPTIQVINKLEFQKNIIRLSTGEMSPDLFPHAMMKTVLNRIPSRAFSLNYLEPLGLLELRKVISHYLKTIGISVTPDQILIVSGSLQALQLVSVGILSPNSTVLIEEPSYLKSLHVFESTGMGMKGVPMDENGLIPWMIEEPTLKSNTSILYTIPSFHNPTGITMSETRRQDVLNWCKSNQLPIIEDDVYRELWFDTPPPLPLKAHDITGNVLYLGSVSKSLAPGLRIGWIAAPEPIVERLGDIKMQTDYGSSSLSQWALTEWMESGLYEDHLKTFRVQLIDRRNHVLNLLKKHFTGLASWNIPSGGFYIWLKLNASIPTEKLFEQAIQKNILINPGSLYSFNKNPHLRISYAYASIEDLTRGLKQLSEIIESLLK